MRNTVKHVSKGATATQDEALGMSFVVGISDSHNQIEWTIDFDKETRKAGKNISWLPGFLIAKNWIYTYGNV